jgi:hypothetical protein
VEGVGDSSSTQDTSALITMAPPLKGYKSEEAAQAAGNFTMTDYFKRTRPGRPKKRGNQASDSIEVVRSSKKKKRGPVPKEKKKRGPSPKRKDAPVAAGSASIAKKKGIDNEEMKKKAPRTNWGVGRAKERMESAVADWLGKTGNALDDNDEQYSLKQFSCVVNIPYDTLKKWGW